MSPSLASHAVVGLLRVTGVKKRQFKPSRFLAEVANPAPPRLPGVTVRREEFEGWTVYRLTPANPVRHYAVYLHGGAWAAPITTQHWRLAARIAVGSGREVVLPLYPRLPAATHADVLPVMLRLFQHVQEQGPTALAGDSAGATIALSVLQALASRSQRPDVTVLISPALDLTFTNPKIADIAPHDPLLNLEHIRVLAARWAAPDDPSNPQTSPLNGRLDHLGLVHVYAGTRDVLFPDAVLLRDRAGTATGTDLHLNIGEGMIHDWPILPTPEGRRAAGDVIALLRDAGDHSVGEGL
ncbi:alpha/beta hydrolase [Micromonospora sp. WMMD961]|uniref:alpha/beta hydrolase fold domain-containing protein n=1 Tax=Micromonospora sp. WMMD961 TaxID=3016100 RepID=UPI00241714D3|nr:alpha/beta hydrolase [Micromonospora sp. WMMD961]MDG4782443.1 alpha/beta hydrolase [Micromonospora sp. WMMD961]